jgi:outer membrane protein TolC
MFQYNGKFRVSFFPRILLGTAVSLLPAAGQQNPILPQQPGPQVKMPTAQAPLTLTLQDALARAQRYETSFLAAANAADIAREDTLQARAALYPSVGLRSEYLNTQGNGVFPSGRYVTNDGVHVYREWSVFHQDLSPGTWTKSGYNRASAAQALARAKVEVARRGLAVTVTKAYYSLVAAQRKYASAQLALEQAQTYLTISQQLERGGEAPHSDVVKAQIQHNSQDQALREAKLAMANSRLDLAVLTFPDFTQDFQVVDDLNQAPTLPPRTEVEVMAKRQNPDLQAAQESLRGANQDITVARQAFLPTLSVDLIYGLEANQIGWNTVVAADPQKGSVPSPGYFLTAAATFPVWDWGARKSKLKQALLHRQQANAELSATQRTILRELNGFYEEAETARDELDLLRQSSDLAAENLRLNKLRYQGGEATVLELVDAQNTLAQARNAYDDGLVRYRVALANLQTVTGTF